MHAQFLDIAKGAAYLAAETLRARHSLEIQSQEGHDIKLSADKAAEKRIIDFLRRVNDTPILSEECGLVSQAPSKSKFQWVIDPLDGTYNYFRGIPVCCISIALMEQAKPVLGVILDLYHNELYSGVVGEGAWLNDRPIKVSASTNLHQAILCTGFPVSADYSPESLSQTIGLIRGFKKIRMLGSAALSLAFVAGGKADAYFEKGIRLWDIAAGLAIVEAAGGVVHMEHDPAKDSYICVAASNATISGQLGHFSGT